MDGQAAELQFFFIDLHELQLSHEYDRHVAVLIGITGGELLAGSALILYGYLDRSVRVCPASTTETTDRFAAVIHSAL